MPAFIIALLLEVALIVHIVKTGRSTTWIWIIVMLPLAGGIAYILVELLPDITRSRPARKASSKLDQLVNPNRKIKKAAFDYSVSNTVENSMRLAEECLEKKMFNEACEFYSQCLRGVHKDDPDIMYGLARAEFGRNNFAEARSVLDRLIEKNADYKNADAHLLYAKSLEALEETDRAMHEYEVLDEYYPGPEATYHYAMLLKKTGYEDKARTLLDKIMHNAKVSGRRYNDLHKEWIRRAEEEITR